MGKKKAKKNQSNNVPAGEIIEPTKVSKWYSPNVFKLQVLALIITGLICYANSFNNQYALDDDIDFWNNYGYGCIYINKEYNVAKIAFEHGLQLDPSNKKILNGIALLNSLMPVPSQKK